MSENIFEKFNSMIDVEGLKNDVAKAAENDGNFVQVPHDNYEVKAKVLERIQEGQSLLNIVSQQQEQLAKMSAVINQMAGRAILPVDSGPGGNPAAPKPAPGGAAMENENDAARRNSTAYADRLAKRSAVDLGGGK